MDTLAGTLDSIKALGMVLDTMKRCGTDAQAAVIAEKIIELTVSLKLK